MHFDACTRIQRSSVHPCTIRAVGACINVTVHACSVAFARVHQYSCMLLTAKERLMRGEEYFRLSETANDNRSATGEQIVLDFQPLKLSARTLPVLTTAKYC